MSKIEMEIPDFEKLMAHLDFSLTFVSYVKKHNPSLFEQARKHCLEIHQEFEDVKPVEQTNEGAARAEEDSASSV